MNDSQATAVLTSKVLKYNMEAKNVSNDEAYGPWNPEQVRESIIASLYNYAKSRVTLPDGTLVVLTNFGTMVTMKAREIHGAKLVDITGYFGGTEEYDGEDSGVFTFWMNASSIADVRTRLTQIPKATVRQVIMEVRR